GRVFTRPPGSLRRADIILLNRATRHPHKSSKYVSVNQKVVRRRLNALSDRHPQLHNYPEVLSCAGINCPCEHAIAHFRQTEFRCSRRYHVGSAGLLKAKIDSLNPIDRKTCH
ncbi:hypothetical protein, partial [Caballeronia sordidicola]|uniref:hypothetical protein n=1 Tax=Caballeronia sordidicola TaxID=196367 RepID=UPI001C529947